jgi:hypothetical protein
MARQSIVHVRAEARSDAGSAQSRAIVSVSRDETLQTPTGEDHPLAVLSALPVRGRSIVTAGAGIAVLGAVAPLVLGATSTVLSWLAHGGFLLPAGASTAMVGLLKAYLDGRAAAMKRAAVDNAAFEDGRSIQALLRPDGTHQTVEWIAAQTRLPEARVVAALLQLRDLGELEEELDVESGEWFYRPVPTSAASLTLDERAKRHGGHKPRT